MANKDYDKEDGVWRTIGGRKVFIRNGQSLSDAMKESGKFSRVQKNQELYKKVDEENKKIDELLDKNKKKEMPKEEDEKKELARELAREIYGKNISDEKADKYAEELLTLPDGTPLDGYADWEFDKEKLEWTKEGLQNRLTYMQKGYDEARKQGDEFAKAYKEKNNAQAEMDETNRKIANHLENVSNVAKEMGDEKGARTNQLASQYAREQIKGNNDEKKTIHTASGDYTPEEINKRDKEIKDLYKSQWNGEMSAKELNDKLEKMRQDGKVSYGELSALQYDASREFDKELDNQSSNKKANVNTISQEEYDKKPKDYKGTLKELVDTAEFRGENKEQLRKEYEAMGYDVDKDKTIVEYENGGATLKPVKISNPNEVGFVQETTMHGGEFNFTNQRLKEMEEQGIRPMKSSYTGGGWEGVNSHQNLSTSEEAKAITDAMKKKHPDVKISRRTENYAGGSSIHFSVMSSDKDLFVSDSDIDKMNYSDLEQVTRSNNFNWWAKDNVPGYNENRSYSIDDVRRYAKEDLANSKQRDIQSVTGNEWYLNDYGKQVMKDLNKEANSYTYDDSDGMIDYFNHGTYMWVNIGKWDKPYQVTGNSMTSALKTKAYQKYMKEHPSSKLTFEEFKKQK